MLDLGRSLIATAERNPAAEAIVDGAERLTYGAWLQDIAAVASGLERLGLGRGDHLALVLQNRIELATLHWACQLAAIIATPLNWRAKAEEVAYCLADAGAKAVVFEPVSADAVLGAAPGVALPRIAVGGAEGTLAYAALAGRAWRSDAARHRR